MKKAAIFLIKLYQKTISMILPHNCRFTPTCSEYCVEAIKTFGLIKGTFLGIRRILKCNPFGPTGYDPVPCKKKRKNKNAPTK